MNKDQRIDISVIIACYNQAHFLPEAIESVLKQTTRSVEIIVVDDGSMDHTAEVASRYPEIRYFRQNHSGPGRARNKGITNSTGTYLVFLDADDILFPDALRIGLECFRQHPEASFVYGDHLRVASGGSIRRKPELPFVNGDYYFALLRGNCVEMMGSAMFRRDKVESVGGFDPALSACEDYDLYLRLAEKFSVFCHRKIIAEYRFHQENLSRDVMKMLKTSVHVLKSQERNIKNRDLRAAFQEGLNHWKEFYGTQLIDKMVINLGEKRHKAVLKTIMTLVRDEPTWFIRHVFNRCLKACQSFFAKRTRGSSKATATERQKSINFGSFRHVQPLSAVFGYDRGLPIDRFYIEKFLERHASDIQGRVLEIGDNTYTTRFGGTRVKQSEVLNVRATHSSVTYVGDLQKADDIPGDRFDCIILTQTLQLIYNPRAALSTLYRILVSGGILLATFPGISQIDRGEWRESWYWGFTRNSAQKLFEEIFSANNVKIESNGNVLATISFLEGLAAEDLTQEELDYNDPCYQLLITVRAVKESRNTTR